MWPKLQRWRGVVLVALASIATVSLALGNQLVLYIHPRYIVFTAILAVAGLALAVASVLTRPARDPDETADARGRTRIIGLGAIVVAGTIALGMVVLPPATLSSATAQQRDINASTIGADAQDVDSAASAPVGASKSFTVVDWASLLRQTNDVDFYADKPVDVVGFVTPDADDPENVFYVSRFFVTCCAVDAQPAGVPVYLPGWSSTLKADDWVQVTGEFGTNPSSTSAQALAIDPAAVVKVEQPSEPYLF